MATWNELNAEVRALGTTFDIVRRKYLGQEDPALHDAVLSVHNAALLTFMNTPAYRLIENQDGLSFIQADAPAV